MKNIHTILPLAFIGLCLSAAIGALVLFALPPGLASTVYLWPGTYIAPVLGKITPTSFLYWLVPDGGAPAYLLLIAIGALFSWAVLCTAVAFVIRRVVRPNNSFKPTPLRGAT
jgi:hypothetical protein